MTFKKEMSPLLHAIFLKKTVLMNRAIFDLITNDEEKTIFQQFTIR